MKLPFIGYYGGILGLFTGFSFISVLEIIYFAVISFVNNGSNKKKKTCRKINCLGHLAQESFQDQA